ncbi:MAG: M55 family metallopeptidase [Solirubrobacterales bacterium]
MNNSTKLSMRTSRQSIVGPRILSCILVGCLLLSMYLAPGQAANPLRIYIVTDLEGASGVYRFAQTREIGPLQEKAKEYLMGDIAAVVRGLRAGGATDVVILDGHGSQAFVPELMAPGAKYITGLPRPGHLTCLDDSFAGMVQLAAHAMMGTSDGVLCHTQSSRSENRYWYNGVESGELAQCAAIAGRYGVPTILVTGDEATCREAKQFFGPDCVTVAVKRGLSREAAELYPFDETRQALFEGARRSVAAIGRCKPYQLSLPIQAKKEYLEGGDPNRRITKEGVVEDVLKLLDF